MVSLVACALADQTREPRDACSTRRARSTPRGAVSTSRSPRLLYGRLTGVCRRWPCLLQEGANFGRGSDVDHPVAVGRALVGVGAVLQQLAHDLRVVLMNRRQLQR